jgi:hypothetical protein
MKNKEILKICIDTLRPCAVSLLFIILGLFLATVNAPAAVNTTLASGRHPTTDLSGSIGRFEIGPSR